MSNKREDATAKEIISFLKSLQWDIEECEGELVKGEKKITKYEKTVKGYKNKIAKLKKEMTHYEREIRLNKDQIKEDEEEINGWVKIYFKDASDNSYVSSKPEIKDMLAYLYWEKPVSYDLLKKCSCLSDEEIKKIAEERAEIYLSNLN